MTALHTQNDEADGNAFEGKNRCDSPYTCDTAYSSMKQSASPASLSPAFSQLNQNYDVSVTIQSFLNSVQNNDQELCVADIEGDVQMADSSMPIVNTMTDLSLNEPPFCPLIDIVHQKTETEMKNVQILSDHADETQFKNAIYHLWLDNKSLNSTRTSAGSSSASKKRRESTASALVVEKKRRESTASALTVERKMTSRQKDLEIRTEIKRKSMHRTETTIHNSRVRESEESKQQKKAEKLKLIEENIREFNMKIHPSNYLLRNVPKHPVCHSCLEGGDVIKCRGSCNGYYHKKCSSVENVDYFEILKKKMKITKKQVACKIEPEESCDETENLDVLCQRCVNETNECSVCFKRDGDCVRCIDKSCNRFYHLQCLKYWPQHKKYYGQNVAESILCPRHICHTCISPDVRNLFQNAESDKKLIKCLLCSSTYHRLSMCIPAGSELLSETQLICPRHHNIKKTNSVNVNHCSICSESGKLICCDTCPHAFHENCLNVPIGDQYICEECESGRRPLFGEIVWAKYFKSDWWPAIIVPTPNVPEKVAAKKPGPNHLCVFFFGTHDYGWLPQVIPKFLDVFRRHELKTKRFFIITAERVFVPRR